MGNLFVVSTPFQLFVAQQIIGQENLVDNILVLGYGRHNEDTYCLMIIPDYWKVIKYIEYIAEINVKHPFQLINIHWSIHKICSLYKIKNVYLGDINRLAYKLIAIKYSKKGYNIIYFEEGSSHYFYYPLSYPRNGIIYHVIAFLLDILLFFPLFHFGCGRFLLYKSLSWEKLPIYARYSICPYYIYVYDKQLKIHEIFSEKLLEYISGDLKNIQHIKNIPKVLFLDQPFYQETSGRKNQFLKISELIYMQIIDEYLIDNKIKYFIIKFHPRTELHIKNKIIYLLEQYQIQYEILSPKYLIPVEYYLQKADFDEIVTFLSSTILYNGLIYRKLKVVLLADRYLSLCEQNGLSADVLKEKVNQIKGIMFQ